MEETRLWVFAGGLAVFGAAESLWPERPWTTPRGRRWGFHLAFAVFNGGLVRILTSAPFFLWAAYVLGRGWGILPWLGLTGWAEICLAVVLLDGMNYLWHRLNHEWHFLWRFHAPHHADDHVDTSTSLRFHPGELLLSWVAKALWVLLVGPSVGAFALFETLISACAQFHHSNLRLGRAVDRAIRIFVPSPLYHAAHHTRERRSRDGNYSTIFSLWDHLFRTYHVPEAQNLTDLGLPGPQRPLNVWEFVSRPFRQYLGNRS